MKKLIILLLLIAISLQADIDRLQYLYDKGEYKKVLFKIKASLQDYEKAQLHFLWAKSAEATGRTNEAMSAYERVLMIDEHRVDARMALVKIYVKTDREALAKKEALELQNYQLTPQQRTALDLLTQTSVHALKLNVTFNIGHDTNINVNPGSAALQDYNGNIKNSDEISTLFERFIGSLSYINELDESGGWYLRSDLNAYYQNNKDAHNYDMFVGGVSLGGGYAGEGYTIYLPLLYDRVNYLDKSLFENYRFEPNLNFAMTENFILNLNMLYKRRDYIQTADEVLSDNALGGGLSLYYIFGKNFIYLNSKYESYEPQEKSDITFLDKTLLTSKIGINYNLTSRFLTRLDYKFRLGQYEDKITTSYEPSTASREDTFHQVELKLSYYIVESFELYLSDSYTQNNSNYLLAEYSKNIAMFGISLSY